MDASGATRLHDRRDGMDRIVELERRRDAALELIKAAIADDRAGESEKLSEENAGLRAGLEAAEAALKTRTMELEAALRSVEEAEVQGEAPDGEPPGRADSGELLEALRALKSKIDDLSDGLTGLETRVARFSGSERDGKAESDSSAAGDGDSGKFERLRRMRENDLAEVNAVLEQLAPLVDGG